MSASIRTEYENRLRLEKSAPELAPFLPALRLARRYGLYILQLPLLNAIPGERICFEAAMIVSRLRHHGALGPISSADKAQRERLTVGIREISRRCGHEFGRRFEDYVERAGAVRTSIGPSHGDFHPGNLMMAENGVPQLIDFDCCRVTGIQGFDPLYFAIESAASAEARSWRLSLSKWCNDLESLLDKTPLLKEQIDTPPEILLPLFIVDRIGQERMQRKFCQIEVEEIRRLVRSFEFHSHLDPFQPKC